MRKTNYEKKARIRFIQMIILELVLIFSSNCEKDGNNKSITITDIDGNIYKTVTIGTQVWMAQDLKTTKFNDTLNIPLVDDRETWSFLTTPGYCLHSHGFDRSTDGAYYNFYAVSTGKLCPTEWHVPSDEEWTILTNYLGGERLAGGKMKEAGNSHWISPNEGATNESGFTALPGYYRNDIGSFWGIDGSLGWWWSATESETIDGFSRYIQAMSIPIVRTHNRKVYGFNVRCIRDL